MSTERLAFITFDCLILVAAGFGLGWFFCHQRLSNRYLKKLEDFRAMFQQPKRRKRDSLLPTPCPTCVRMPPVTIFVSDDPEDDVFRCVPECQSFPKAWDREGRFLE